MVRALRAAAPGPSRTLLDAGLDAKLGHEDALSRAATAFLAFSAFNLSDDLSDRECDYLPPGEAPAVLLIVNSLFFSGLRDLALRPELEAEVLGDLVSAEEAQVIELSTKYWDAERLRIVTDGIAGRQWSAYLRLIWADTPLEHLAPDVAHSIGRVALLADDISSGDARYTELPAPDQRVMVLEALQSAQGLEAIGLPFTRSVLATSKPILLSQLAVQSSVGQAAEVDTLTVAPPA